MNPQILLENLPHPAATVLQTVVYYNRKGERGRFALFSRGASRRGERSILIRVFISLRACRFLQKGEDRGESYALYNLRRGGFWESAFSEYLNCCIHIEQVSTSSLVGTQN